MSESVLEHPITDIEKMFALFAKLFEDMRDIRAKLQDAKFPIDVYDDDPSGTTGILSPNAAYNGPWIVEYIVATWVPTGVTSVTLQLGDRILQLPVTAGSFNAQTYIELARDDSMKLTVTPAAACHIELSGYARKRIRDTAE
jgi:hypothetical protein